LEQDEDPLKSREFAPNLPSVLSAIAEFAIKRALHSWQFLNTLELWNPGTVEPGAALRVLRGIGDEVAIIATPGEQPC
jgi:hypothetical protein